jgi:ferrous iron transport protein B
MHGVLKSPINKIPVVSIVGPPNSGKTTLFNFLSGEKSKSVNYPGSTIECKESLFLKKFKLNAVLIDSPGIVSIVPNSPEEKIAIDYLLRHPKYGFPDIVIVTIDSSQLSRHLLLAKQIIDSGATVIIALTMLDILKEKGYDLCLDVLSNSLECKVIKIDGRYGIGLEDLTEAIDNILNDTKYEKNASPSNSTFSKEKLINIFKEIEIITEKVIYKSGNGNSNLPDFVKKANSQFVIKGTRNSNLRLKPDDRTVNIDKFVLHKYWGILIFILIMGITFTSIFWLASPLMSLVDSSFSRLSEFVNYSLPQSWFRDLISSGLISGTGAVFIFIPQIIILFLILGFLEDTGYLARGAMLIDKPLSKIGLNGRSFVPMLSGFACAIPAIMATRTIQNKRERFLTIFIIPLISCSARLPVYTLLIGFLFYKQPFYSGLSLTIIYLFSITISLVIAGIINKFQSKILKVEDNSSFIMELPSYRIPKIRVVLQNTVNNLNQYLKKAGPIIISFSIILWFLTYFPNHNVYIPAKDNMSNEEIKKLETSARLENSYAAKLGNFIEPVMKPLGMDWRIGVSLIATFAAREVFVSSLALIFKVTDEGGDIQATMIHTMQNAKIEGTQKKLFTSATIIGLIVIFIFALQCISTIAISKKETGSWRIPALQVLIYSSLAYIFAFISVNGLKALGME